MTGGFSPGLPLFDLENRLHPSARHDTDKIATFTKRISASDQGRRKEKCERDSACDEDLTGPKRWLVNASPGLAGNN
jgi:hypothetical protein